MRGLFDIMKLNKITHPINWSNIKNHKPHNYPNRRKKCIGSYLMLILDENLKRKIQGYSLT